MRSPNILIQGQSRTNPGQSWPIRACSRPASRAAHLPLESRDDKNVVGFCGSACLRSASAANHLGLVESEGAWPFNGPVSHCPKLLLRSVKSSVKFMITKSSRSSQSAVFLQSRRCLAEGGGTTEGGLFLGPLGGAGRRVSCH